MLKVVELEAQGLERLGPKGFERRAARMPLLKGYQT